MLSIWARESTGHQREHQMSRPIFNPLLWSCWWLFPVGERFVSLHFRGSTTKYSDHKNKLYLKLLLWEFLIVFLLSDDEEKDEKHPVAHLVQERSLKLSRALKKLPMFHITQSQRIIQFLYTNKTIMKPNYYSEPQIWFLLIPSKCWPISTWFDIDMWCQRSHCTHQKNYFKSLKWV